MLTDIAGPRRARPRHAAAPGRRAPRPRRRSRRGAPRAHGLAINRILPIEARGVKFRCFSPRPPDAHALVAWLDGDGDAELIDDGGPLARAIAARVRPRRAKVTPTPPPVPLPKIPLPQCRTPGAGRRRLAARAPGCDRRAVARVDDRRPRAPDPVVRRDVARRRPRPAPARAPRRRRARRPRRPRRHRAQRRAHRDHRRQRGPRARALAQRTSTSISVSMISSAHRRL